MSNHPLSSIIVDTFPPHVVYFLRRMMKRPLLRFTEHHPCIWTLSTGRAGTQTLAALLSLAHNVVAYHEPRPRLYALGKICYEDSHAYTDKFPIFQKIAFDVRRLLWASARQVGRGYAETSPQVTFFAPFFADEALNFGTMKFIHLYRDPHDVTRSGMRREWYQRDTLNIEKIVPHDDFHANRWHTYSSFEKVVWYWTITNQWILDFLETIPSQSYIQVDAESMFRGNRATLQKIYDFVGVSVPSNRRINSILHQQLNAQMRRDFPKADEWTVEMKTQMYNLAGDTARKLGYDLSI